MVFGDKGKRLIKLSPVIALVVLCFNYIYTEVVASANLSVKVQSILGASYSPKEFPNLDTYDGTFTLGDINQYLSEVHQTDLSSPLDPKGCHPRKHIGFLKTRKTASTTVGNILMRYGYYGNLNFVLPLTGNHLGDPRNQNQFQIEMIEDAPWHENYLSNKLYHIAALHTRWNQTAMDLLLGKDALYITLLREPSSAFESLFSYYRFQVRYNMTMEDYIQRLLTDANWQNERFHDYLGLNQQAWQIGMTKTQMRNELFVKEIKHWMDSRFHLVMIMEQLEESLVLLSKLLCLPLSLMASLSKNVRLASSRKKLDEEHKHILKMHQGADERLYEFFKLRLDKQVEAFGRKKMEASVNELRRFNKFVNDTCVDGLETKVIMEVPMMQTIVKKEPLDCRLHGANQPNIIEMVRRKQFSRWTSDQS